MNTVLVTPGAARWVARLRRPAFRVAAGMAALSTATLFGVIVATQRIPPTLLLVPAAACLAYLVWQRGGVRFETMILAIVLSGGLVNFVTLPTGTESRIVISLILSAAALGLWLLELLTARRLQLVSSPVIAPLLTFAAVSIVAFAWSMLFRDTLVWVPGSFPVVQAASLTVNLVLVFLTLLVANKVRQVRWLKLLTIAMLGMGTLYMLTVLTGNPLQQYILNNGARGLFGAWVALLAYALALFDERLSRGQRMLLLLLVGLLAYYSFFVSRSWVSGWLPLGVGCAVLTCLRSARLFAVAMLIGLIYVGLNFGYFFEDIVVHEELEGSGTQRVGLWEINYEHMRDHVLFGSGPAGYAVYYMTYHPEDARSSHNNYFDILAQTGIVGFGTFLWLLWAFLRVGQRTRRVTAGRRDFEEAFAAATFAGCFAILVAMMLGDWVLPFAYNQTISGFDNALYSWVFMGAMVSLDNRLRVGATASDEEGDPPQ